MLRLMERMMQQNDWLWARRLMNRSMMRMYTDSSLMNRILVLVLMQLWLLLCCMQMLMVMMLDKGTIAAWRNTDDHIAFESFARKSLPQAFPFFPFDKRIRIFHIQQSFRCNKEKWAEKGTKSGQDAYKSVWQTDFYRLPPLFISKGYPRFMHSPAMQQPEWGDWWSILEKRDSQTHHA